MIALRLDGAIRRRREAGAAAAAAAAAQRRRGRGAACAARPRRRSAALRGRTRWQVWLSSQERAPLAAAARAAARTAKTGTDLRLTVDVDPQSVL